MIHVPDPKEGLEWYSRAFPYARRVTVADGSFECLLAGPIQLEIVPADAKVGSGPSGSIVYWRVDDFDEALAHFQEVGATLYRGPMRIEYGQAMCQVRDPWGNCIGLRGLKR
ncbi:MAG: VOC family protein [Vicinamibacterales bacterium]